MAGRHEIYDVVVVGASIAGCTAAVLHGSAGLRVALVERQQSADAYKALCGHFILGGTKPTLDRLGVWDRMLEAGAVASWPSVWFGSEWLHPDTSLHPAISLRRKTLDPMLRAVAASTAGVDLLLGHTVTDVLEGSGGAIAGVRTRDGSGRQRELRGRLVVAADGHASPVARLARVRSEQHPNNRFFWWAYYAGVSSPAPGGAQVWHLDPDAAVVVPAGEGLTLVGAFPAKARLHEFARDRVGALERVVATLPDAPDLGSATRVSVAVGTSDYPIVRRDPTPRPGLALVGDAATASDPLPALGCGWAFRSAEWLADATIPALLGNGDVAGALAAYRENRRFADEHDAIAQDEALARPVDAVQRAVRLAGTRDRDIARRIQLFAMRAEPVSTLINPEVVERAVALQRV